MDISINMDIDTLDIDMGIIGILSTNMAIITDIPGITDTIIVIAIQSISIVMAIVTDTQDIYIYMAIALDTQDINMGMAISTGISDIKLVQGITLINIPGGSDLDPNLAVIEVIDNLI